jgi:hypothetical protein
MEFLMFFIIAPQEQRPVKHQNSNTIAKQNTVIHYKRDTANRVGRHVSRSSVPHGKHFINRML